MCHLARRDVPEPKLRAGRDEHSGAASLLTTSLRQTLIGGACFRAREGRSNQPQERRVHRRQGGQRSIILTCDNVYLKTHIPTSASSGMYRVTSSCLSARRSFSQLHCRPALHTRSFESCGASRMTSPQGTEEDRETPTPPGQRWQRLTPNIIRE